MHQFIYRVTYLTYTLFCTSITLLSLSIAALVLQTKVLHVFRGLQIQIPGSALIEWEFVSLNPPYLDNGPMIATLVVAVCGILSCVATTSWISGMWGRWCSKTTTAIFGLTTCTMLMLNTGASLSLTTYIFITEAGMTLPERFRLWGTTTFTHEFYVCTAFPSVVPDAEELIYGFPACEDARSARFLLIGITIASFLVTGVSCWQAWKSGIITILMRPGADLDRDAEKATKRTVTPKSRFANQTQRMNAPARVHIPEMVRGPRETRQPVDRLLLISPVPMPDLEDYYYEEDKGQGNTGYRPDRKEPIRQSIHGFYTPL